MTSRVEQSLVQLHAPAFVVGLYFLSLQFVATINLSYLILLAGLLYLLATQAAVNWRAVLSGATLIAASLFAATVLAAHFSANNAVNLNIVVSQIPGLLVFSIVTLFIRNTKQLGCILWAFLIALCFAATSFFIASYRADFARGVALIFYAAHPLYLAANDVLMLSIFLPLTIWFGQRIGGVAGWLLISSYVILLSLLSLLLLSRISLIVIVVSLALGLASHKRRWQMLLLAAIVFVAALLAAFFADVRFAEKLQSLDLTRLRVWLVAWRMFLDAPWFGQGPGSFSVLYNHYLAQVEPAMRYGHEGRNMGWAHNLFFESAAEKGMVGLATITAYFIYLKSMVNKLKERASDFSKFFSLTVLMFFIAACVEASMLRIWGIYTAYLLLGIAGAFAATGESAAESDLR